MTQTARWQRWAVRVPAPAANPGAAVTVVALAVAFAVALAVPRPGAAQIEVHAASITDLQDAMESGRATSEEITRAYLERIAAYDQVGPAINAIVWLSSTALDEARELDRERDARGPRGPLHGIPVILKDNYDTRDLPTSAGTLALAGFVPPDDAFQVARLRAAGAVVLGKANMEELASGITTISSMGGQTLNPYDLTRNPGGSSGGTAAAVAASFAAVGWGSDTCGSIRIPAAHNDLVGLRPTKGLSSIDGIVPLSHTQDVGGPLARTMRDLAIALDATVGPDPADPATAILEGRAPPSFVDALDEDALAGARIGILEAYFGSAPEESAAAGIVREAIERMVELGADTVTVEIPDLDSLISGSGVINHEFKWDLIDYLAASPDAPVASLAEMMELGLIHQALMPRMRVRDRPEARDTEEYRSALAKRGPLRAGVEGTLNRHSLDALVFPTVRTIPAVIGDPQRGSSCSLSANTGLPSLSVPAGFTERGLPIGMEMIGRTLDDARLVALGYAFEQATDHRRAPPTVPPLVDGRAPGPLALSLLQGEPDGLVGRGSGVSLTGEASLDPARGELHVGVRVRGTSPDAVYAIALRWPAEGGGWQVARRISGPGAREATVTLRLTGPERAGLERGEMHLVVLTEQHPRGAVVARLAPIGGP